MHSANVTHGHLKAIAHNINATRRLHGEAAVAATVDRPAEPAHDQGVNHGPSSESDKQR